MFFPWLLLFLQVSIFSAADNGGGLFGKRLEATSVLGPPDANLEAKPKEETLNEVKQKGMATTFMLGSLEKIIPRSGSAGVARARKCRLPIRRSLNAHSKSPYRTDDDTDDYVNDDIPDNELVYIVFDYDDGLNDKSLHVIDQRDLMASSISQAKP